jgi:putative tryptophan/tyrosine transport system substrate-binding protein
LARPGGNVTGLSLMAPDLAGKRLEILREILREISLVAVLWNVANPYPALVFKQLTDFAAKNRLPAIYGLREFVDAGGFPT